VPDFGFYGRDLHQSYIRDGRLIAGINHLAELPPKLRQAALLIDDKVPSGTPAEDAATLAQYARLIPDTVAHTTSFRGRWPELKSSAAK
jgi:hypothetical protein